LRHRKLARGGGGTSFHFFSNKKVKAILAGKPHQKRPLRRYKRSRRIILKCILEKFYDVSNWIIFSEYGRMVV